MAAVPGKNILPETSILFICDVQETFRRHCRRFNDMVEVIGRLVSLQIIGIVELDNNFLIDY